MDDKATDNPAIHIARAKRAIACILISGIGLLVATGFSGTRLTNAIHPTSPPIPFRLDPNKATWSELAQLPALGESAARRIIAYRDRPDTPKPAFQNPGDLDRVQGIGIKTATRIAPYLRFPSN